ncbi:hypothetical protein AAG570_010998 [Ranatra chinensis]|uniref:Methyltransferase-like 26 n=1 Tax=Ranatra chinensis TaxID=642074 RepID=A0ABD0YJD0_9HEMI
MIKYFSLGAQKTSKHCHPAAERNKEPILSTLKLYINKPNAKLLEISSGSGQHVAHIAPHFPSVTFQPTEFEKSSINSINAYVAESPSKNILTAQELDVRQPAETWLGGTIEQNSLDYMLNINLIHISEWACTEGLFKGGSYALKPGGLLFTYGPYAVDGTITPESNVSFDAMLRSQNPGWGLRDIHKQLVPLANKLGIRLKHFHDLPANNKLLVWEKETE